MKKRAFLVSAIATLVTLFLLFLYLRRFEQDMSGGDRIRLLVVVKPIERNAVITDDMLAEREVPTNYVEDRAVKRAEKPKVIGLRVGNAMLANQTLMWTDLAIATDERRDLSSLVQPGNRAVTIRALGEESKSGALVSPGDYVDVVATMTISGGADQRELQSVVLLQRILVLAIGLDTTVDTRAVGASDTKDRGSKYSRDLMLTLSINLQEAQLLTLAQDRGKLSVALRNPDDQRIIDGIQDMKSGDAFQRGERDKLPVSSKKGPAAGPVRLGDARRDLRTEPPRGGLSRSVRDRYLTPLTLSALRTLRGCSHTTTSAV